MKFKESIPKSEYLLDVGDIFLSAGSTFIYEVVYGPVCKLYRDPNKPGNIEPWGTESSWYDTGCPIKGWRRNGPNYPSYWVNIIDPDTLERSLTSISLRWIPNKLTLIEAIKLVRSNRSLYRSSSSSIEEINIPLEIIKNIQSNVDFMSYTC